MHYDAALARYAPQRKATFLFIARDGSPGILRVTGQVTRKWSASDMGKPYIAPDESDPNQTTDAGQEFGVKFDYKFFYEETAQMRAENKAREEAASARATASQQKKTAALLEKNPQIEGTVLSPGGLAASNAAILLAISGEPVVLAEGRFAYESKSTIIHTRADGGFVIPLQPHTRAYVAHEDGFSEVNLDGAKSPLEIHLKPWGHIEGTVTLEGKPAPHQKMALLDASGYSPSEVHLSLSFNAESDDQGRFAFDGVPPGEVKVCRLVGNTFYEEQVVDVVPGKTTLCRHGFDGRVVKGHLVASGPSKIQDWTIIQNWKKGLNFRFSTQSLVPDPPKNVDASAWAVQYWQSAEGNRARRASHNFAVSVQRNGDFQVEDVPPGTYELSADLHEGDYPLAGVFYTGKTLGQLKQEVVIPPGIPSDGPFDLGTLAVPMMASLKPGDPAPNFAINTVDGVPLRLADYCGKFVLLDFWGTWCGPCRGETPSLKAVFDEFAANAKFAMVGLSLDKTAAAPASYARTNGMRWAQGHLGEWAQTSLPTQYGIEGIPAIFLLDPNGKIVATDLRGEKIGEAVRAALESR